MPTRTFAGANIEVDDLGYLKNMDDWNKEIAAELAKEAGINELNDTHWKVIEFMRKDTKEKGQPPSIRRITKLSGVSTKELYACFPGGPGKMASKIAGVPKPESCV